MRIVPMSKVAVVVLTLACEGSPTAPELTPPPEVAVPTLAFASGDVVEIDVRLSGCFHDNQFRAVLRVVGDSAIVERFSGTGNMASTHRFEPVNSLTQAQLAGLRELLDEYRRPARGQCTSLERGSIRVTRDGSVVHAQRFHDSACRFFEESVAFHWFMLASVIEAGESGG